MIAMCAVLLGSSPLTRGKRDRLPDLRRESGLIPAHAGKTETLTLRVGEREGSSPLTRGKPSTWR